MENALDFNFVDKMLYKITHFGPGRTKADARTAIMRYQKDDVFEKWHYTFSHPMEIRDESKEDFYTTSGECGIRPDEVVKIEPVSEAEVCQWKEHTIDFMTRIIAHYGKDYCYEDVNDVVGYNGPKIVYQ